MADVTTDQNFPRVTLNITDAGGDPAQVESVRWASSDDTVLSVDPSDDGMSAVIDTVAAGTARVTVTADADLGSGVLTLTGVTEDIHVTLGTRHRATTMTLTLGAPADKP